ncbi:SOS response-associated peptidase [Halovenus rubra]|uniref:SOS response-associated peptidase n=2 Tax=Halovenus rubra TaxID=869890 RepID=A0ACC7DYV5_9EURY|nr:SOS response-associated peptidase [Halovenus rubra]
MCGRYSLFTPAEKLAERFDVDVSAYKPRYNAAPSQSLPVITDTERNTLKTVEWGLVPQWADSRDDGGHINARGESLTTTASFRDAFEQQSEGELTAGRCLVPADGFYEWVETDGGKQPYRVARADERPFAMAGLWTQWHPPTTQTGLGSFADGSANVETDIVETFTIVTTEPNDLVEDLHHRMAVILEKEDEQQWLNGSVSVAESLLEPYPPDSMQSYPVSKAVNNPSNDSPALVEPVDVDSGS